MAKKQSTQTSQIALVTASKPRKASIKLTKIDRLAVAIFAVRDGDDTVETAIEMNNSPVFREFMQDYLREIASTDHQENKEIAMVSCLARLYLAMGLDVSC